MHDLPKNSTTLKKKSVLYISPDGILEPLGDSQVLKYLENLSEEFEINLISFEKKEDLNNRDRFRSLKNRCDSSNISWHCLKYRHGIFGFSQIINILNFVFYPIYVMIIKRCKIIHIRSYMPGLSIPILSIIFKFKFIFDIRGFWADEKHDRLGWSKNSNKYKFFKTLEKYLFKKADAVVTLTNSSKKYISTKFNKSMDKIHMIRTCVDFQEFNLPEKAIRNTNLTIGYLGTIDTAYDFNKFLKFIWDIRKFNKNIEINLLTKSPNKQIEDYLKKNNLSDVKYINQFLERDQLHAEIIKFDLLAFCLKENFSIIASMPTKIGESLACGVPILCNSFNEDIKQIIQDEGVGEIYDFNGSFDADMYKSLELKINDINIAVKCNEVARKEFSLESGTLAYKTIYQAQ